MVQSVSACAEAMGSSPTDGDNLTNCSSPKHPRVFILRCVLIFGLTHGKTCDNLESHVDNLQRQLQPYAVTLMPQ